MTARLSSVNSWIFTNSPYIWKIKKSCIGWIRKNLRIHSSYNFCDFHSKWQFRLEYENFEISRNSAYQCRIRFSPTLNDCLRYIPCGINWCSSGLSASTKRLLTILKQPDNSFPKSTFFFEPIFSNFQNRNLFSHQIELSISLSEMILKLIKIRLI